MKDIKPNILVLDNSPSITGAYKSILSVSEALRKDVTFFFALSSHHLVEDVTRRGLKPTYIPFLEIQKNWRLLIYFPLLFLNTFRLWKLINKQRINIVHVNDLYNMCGIILKFFIPELKVIYHVRLLPSSYVKIIYPIWKIFIERYANQIICVSESVARNFKKEKITVIYDAIPEEEIKSSKPGTKNGKIFTILYLSNYIPGKGHKQAIEAYNMANPYINNTQLMFIGGTLGNENNKNHKKYLEKYVLQLGLQEHVHFLDFVKDPKNEVINADLMLNFSESESFSMTTLEALVYGTPIIATDCGGPGEIIENEKSGILVPVNDINTMATEIENLVNDTELRESISQNGRKRAEKFNLKNQANLLQMLYYRLLS